MAEIGDLRYVEDIRDLWSNEAQDFTPWLAENLDRLTGSLGMELELEGVEVPVGAYQADIVAQVPASDGVRVVIENQLENANLRHLGQVQVYLVGLDAKIIVWIATGFNGDILATIRWLNEHTSDPFAFFAVRVRAVRIGDSLPAPVFDVLERPNDWDREVTSQAKSGLTRLGELWRDFWRHYSKRYPDAPMAKPDLALAHNWYPVGDVGGQIRQSVRRKGVVVELRGEEWGESRDDWLPRVETYIPALEAALKERNLKRTGKGNDVFSSSLSINTRDRANWDKMADWLNETSRIYEGILGSSPESN